MALRVIIGANLAAGIGYRLTAMGRKELRQGDVENITALWAAAIGGGSALYVRVESSADAKRAAQILTEKLG